MSGWTDIETAPYDRPVMVRVEGRRKGFMAVLRKDASLTEDERACDQWQAVNEDYPKCWSDGACWESNADGACSTQPIAWKDTSHAD